MRISDWSSDVCSSDLFPRIASAWIDLPLQVDTCARSRCARQTALAVASTCRRCTRQEVADRRPAMAAPAHEWPGMYRGDIAGTPATLQLTEAGGALHGVIDAGGYRYLLQVRAAGTTAGRSEEHTSEL